MRKDKNIMKHITHLILVFLVAFIISCGSKIENKNDKTDKTEKNEKMPKPDTIVEFKPKEEPKDPNLRSKQTIISSVSGLDSVFGKNYNNWTPSDDDIEQAEKLFREAFDDQKRGTVDWVLYRTFDEYYRQYVGAIDSSGDKVIWINCFCESQKNLFKNWKDKIVMVKKGGNCFLNVSVNLTKNKYILFKVNENG